MNCFHLFLASYVNSAAACLICAICDSPLIPPPEESEGKEEDVSGLKCGHVFHKNCLNQWLCRRQNCPNCRLEITADDVVPKLYFNADEGQAVEFVKTSRQSSEVPQNAEEKPWYEKYKDELLIGGSALMGFMAGAVIASMKSSGKQKNPRQ